MASLTHKHTAVCEPVVRKLYGSGTFPAVVAFVATSRFNKLQAGKTRRRFDSPRLHHITALFAFTYVEQFPIVRELYGSRGEAESPADWPPAA